MAKQVTVTVETVGQAFACAARIRDARTGRRLALTQDRPYGMDTASLRDAEAYAEHRGWEIVSDED